MKEMDSRFVLFLASFLATARYAHAFSTGGPDGACENLMPNHGVPPQQEGQSPYRITVSKSTIRPGEQIEVTVNGSAEFRGFFLRAGQNRAFIGGAFQQNGQGSLKCNNEGFTHSGPETKTQVKVIWTAPGNLNASPIQFIATMVQFKTLFWTNVMSDEVAVGNAAGALITTTATSTGTSVQGSTGFNPISPRPPTLIEPSTTTATFTTTTTTAAANVQNTIPDLGTMGQSTAPSTVLSSENRSGGTNNQNSGAMIVDPDCGKTKGCYHNCNSGDACNYIISWSYEKETVQFNFKYRTPSNSDHWIALGMSHDTLMGDDSVLECVMEGGKVQVKTSYNKGKINEYLDDNYAGLSDATGSVHDGIMACSFRRQIVYLKEPRLFDLSQPYYMMVATGEAVSGNKLPHSFDILPKVSAEKINLQETSTISQGLDPFYPMVKAHGTLMTLAWVFFASSGIFIARHGRSMFNNSKPFGIHVWFHIHRFCMGMTTFLTTLGFILILVESYGHSFLIGTPGKAYRSLHPPLGLILVVVTLVNPLMALFRPDLNSPSRPLFKWSHWGIGMFAWVCSFVLIIIGLDLSKSQADVQAIYVIFAFIGYHLVVDIATRASPSVLVALIGCLRTGSCQNKNSYDIDMTEMSANEVPRENGNELSNKEATSKQTENVQRFKNMITSSILVIHIVLSACFAIAVLYFFLRRPVRSMASSSPHQQ